MNDYKWQPIETAPKDGTYVFLFSPSQFQPPFGIYAYLGRWGWRDTNDEYTPYPEPTHWMPLPEPPSEVSDR